VILFSQEQMFPHSLAADAKSFVEKRDGVKECDATGDAMKISC
jgi:hypothetical protein